MFDFIHFGPDRIQTFLLIILRASGMFMMAPVFSDRTLPLLIKVGLIVALSIVLVPVVGGPLPFEINSFWQLVALGAKEIFLGLLIGLLFRLILHGAKTAGSIIGYQIGFAIVNTPDVEEGGQVSIMGRFWSLAATVIFLSINGHHLMISAFAESYEVIPPGLVAVAAPVGVLMIKYTAYVFVIALKIAAPVMITLFLTDVALGTIAKTMPTMNVFFVGFPIKIGLGLTVIGISLPAFAYVLQKATYYLDQELRLVFAAMGRA